MRVPKGEFVWVGYNDKDGLLRFVMTSKSTRDYYYMYAVNEDGTLTKLGKSKSPPDLESKYNVLKTIGIEA